MSTPTQAERLAEKIVIDILTVHYTRQFLESPSGWSIIRRALDISRRSETNLAGLLARIEELEAKARKIYCPWCMTVYEKGEDPHASVLKHLETCLKHPITERDSLRIQNTALNAVAKAAELVQHPSAHALGDVCPCSRCDLVRKLTALRATGWRVGE